ncbi:single-stranded DNA-binding protein [Cryobacterium sp. TMT1-21]|uniref:Single-stranded DNA-binding protein n=1 Tax=Cryobacterium shii TaxID=1259235 RepID=A0AAQ2HFW2_9MICO|nr:MULTISPECIES: single-stranded DNA-binding protein [Cryobacterium]TFC49818.1 single-stranded DNA-binding protein [Cryobacterium shii]TFC86030.1 single-stranded DNA-binding protein [Cryobacterium sp. TmT2-59]TFD13771.1 single-stranded DNA-binding protein [Cryobacterium sp. TMT4-10]TFD16722.1 single-stranded DNA-binding protein [Cryobacterium sp. TMT1-21]TFD19713.1 single-stranded DNA-binding protein [Cryobacterium sp. TMT2-23]
MSDTITVTGIVATSPRHLVTSSGLAITSFRLASGQRRFDRTKQAWVDADTNWYSVSAFRQLAHNVVDSVQKGQHVVVIGRLRIRAWENADRNGTSVEVEADSVGHDLAWCTTIARRTVASPERQLDPSAETADSAGSAEVQSEEPVELSQPGPLSRPDQDSDGFLPAGSATLVSLET